MMRIVLVAAGVGWSALAQIPITVNAVGALLQVRTINTKPSRAEGKEIWTFNQESRDWHQVVVRFRRANGIRDGDRERSIWQLG